MIIPKRKIPLDGKEWIKQSISIISDIKWSEGEIKARKNKVHPATFPQMLAERFIKIYCPPKGWVFDPFSGTGTTLVASRVLHRNATGIDINHYYSACASMRVAPYYVGWDENHDAWLDKNHEATFTDHNSTTEIFTRDSRYIHKFVTIERPEQYDLCFTSPPYWDIQRQKRTADGKKERPYSDLEEDIGNDKDYNLFLTGVKMVFVQVHKVIKPGGYCIVVIGDIRKKNKFFSLHMDLADRMRGIGWYLDDIMLWDRRSDYNNLRPLGYPYVFRVNKVHEYIIIFRKWCPEMS